MSKPDSASSQVQFTHTERVVFPDKGYTKGDVIDFYLRAADLLLPHLHDRPVTLERLPQGVGGARPLHFWQKDTPPYYPDFIRRITLPTEAGRPVAYTLVNDLPTLMYLVNQNVLTFHTWFSRVQQPDRPDFVLLDIDPHQSTFANAVIVARKVHEILDVAGVANFVKTSGKSGLHVMCPWRARDGGFEQARDWAQQIAQRAADALPKIATTERSISRRGARVYVDAMQNARGKHAVPPYVLRDNAWAGVSMPLQWRELTSGLSPERFDLKSALKRLPRQKVDPLLPLTGAAPRRSGAGKAVHPRR